MKVRFAVLGQRDRTLTIKPGTTIPMLVKRYPKRLKDKEIRVNRRQNGKWGERAMPLLKTEVLQEGDLIVAVPNKIIMCGIKEPHTHFGELESYATGKGLKALRVMEKRMLNTKIVA